MAKIIYTGLEQTVITSAKSQLTFLLYINYMVLASMDLIGNASHNNYYTYDRDLWIRSTIMAESTVSSFPGHNVHGHYCDIHVRIRASNSIYSFFFFPAQQQATL